MDRELNLDFIRALEEQIEEEEHERAIIQLKRSRNSLLNVSTLLPPEILGIIFLWNATPMGDFGGLSKGSYNFLLVCHHWFEVASRTPELWGFWGNSVEDWTHRHARCRAAPLDLVLARYTGRDLDDRLHAALQDCAARDTIRRVHLRSTSPELLSNVISSISMVTEGEETRSNGVESFIVQGGGGSAVDPDISTFFSRHRLPKLQRLCLSRCSISSWDLLKLQTTVLTTLELADIALSPTPSQLLSILSSNLLLQRLSLAYGSTPDVIESDCLPSRIPLHRLKELRLNGDLCHAFKLLNRLEFPDKMDYLNLFLYECSPLDLSQTVGPYFWGHVRRRGRFPGGGLGLSVYHGPETFHFSAGDIRNGDDTTGLGRFAEVSGFMDAELDEGEAERLCLDFMARIPWEEVIDLKTSLRFLHSEDLCVKMCNLTYLHLVKVDLSRWFMVPDLRGPPTFKDLLPSLDRIEITRPILDRCGWSPLVIFLTRRKAVGHQISSLKLNDYPQMSPEVVESIARVVRVFEGRDGGDC